MTNAHDPLPETEDALKPALQETRASSSAEAMIEHLQLVIPRQHLQTLTCTRESAPF
jgi:hypothetical protein